MVLIVAAALEEDTLRSMFARSTRVMMMSHRLNLGDGGDLRQSEQERGREEGGQRATLREEQRDNVCTQSVLTEGHCVVCDVLSVVAV